MDIYLIKASNALFPASDNDRDHLSKIKAGQPVRVTLRRVRNYRFHQKWFALLNFAYDYWEPPENHVAEKNFDRFRKDITILAGFYERYVRIDGTTRVEAKSVSFASMTQDEFENLYQATIDALLKYVLKNYDRDLIDEAVNYIMEFA